MTLPRSHKRLTRSRLKGGGVLKAGKKVKDWNRCRRKIKKDFIAMGIQYCELRFENCTGDDYLGFAHAKKRRHLGPDELSVVILACANCHNVIERLPESEMETVVMKVISEREEPYEGINWEQLLEERHKALGLRRPEEYQREEPVETEETGVCPF